MSGTSTGEARAKALVVIRMEDRQGRPITSPILPRYIAEAMLFVISGSGTYEGEQVAKAIIVPLGVS